MLIKKIFCHGQTGQNKMLKIKGKTLTEKVLLWQPDIVLIILCKHNIWCPSTMITHYTGNEKENNY